MSGVEVGSDHDQIVMLEPSTWADYERLLAVRGERASPRFTFLEGRLEITSPSRGHESTKSVIGRLVEAWCVENGVDFTPYGSWTLENKDAERGLEPDECYAFRDVAEPDRPDLAIEVVWTPRRLNKLEVYRKLSVREVWVWTRGRSPSPGPSPGPGGWAAYALRGEAYEPIERSEVLSGIDLEQLASFVSVRPVSRAVRAYRAARTGR